MILRHPSRLLRAFSLIEALAVILVVSIAVPPMAAIARTRALAVSDGARRHAAMILAAGVIESIIADSESTNAQLGFEGFARGDYLSAPVIGLRTRLTSMAAPATALGITYDVTIGSPVDSSGNTALYNTTGALRLVTVTPTWVNAAGQSASLPITTLVVNR